MKGQVADCVEMSRREGDVAKPCLRNNLNEWKGGCVGRSPGDGQQEQTRGRAIEKTLLNISEYVLSDDIVLRFEIEVLASDRFLRAHPRTHARTQGRFL